MTEWVAVEDGLPGKAGRYLAKPRRGGIFIATLCFSSTAIQGKWHDKVYWAETDINCGYCDEITHWMPLPELEE